MKKKHIIEAIESEGIIAVVRVNSSQEAFDVFEACVQGGIKCIELTFTVANAASILKELNTKYGNRIYLGAGTILNETEAKTAIENGAKYLISPGFDEQTAQLCNTLDILYIPGCMTLTEMMQAMKHDIELIKLFPGSVFGPSYVKAIKGPLPNIKLIPTGGVSIDNMEAWFKQGVYAVGIGGELTAPSRQGQFDKVKENAQFLVNKFKQIKNEQKDKKE